MSRGCTRHIYDGEKVYGKFRIEQVSLFLVNHVGKAMEAYTKPQQWKKANGYEEKDIRSS